MSSGGKRWTVYDRDGNSIYLTDERWMHIVDFDNHPEVTEYESHLKVTLRKGHRRQEPLNPRKYRYVFPFDDLPDEFSISLLLSYLALTLMNKAKQYPTIMSLLLLRRPLPQKVQTNEPDT